MMEVISINFDEQALEQKRKLSNSKIFKVIANYDESDEFDNIYYTFDDNHNKVSNQIVSSNNTVTFKGDFTYFQTFLFIMNNMIGGGIIVIPVIYNDLGIIFASLLIVFFAVLSYFSLVILLKIKTITGKSGYSTLGRLSFGRFGYFSTKFFLIFFRLGQIIAYLRIIVIVIKSFFMTFFKETDSFQMINYHNWVYILSVWVVLAILIFNNLINIIKFSSMIGLISMIIYIIVIFILFIIRSYQENILFYFILPENFINIFFINADTTIIISNIPIIFLGFTFHHGLFSIYSSLNQQNLSKMRSLCKISLLTSVFIYIFTGVLGLIIYGNGYSMENTILNSIFIEIYEGNNKNSMSVVILNSIILLSFLISCTMSIPLIFLGLRRNIMNTIIFIIRIRKQTKKEVKINTTQDFDDNISISSEGTLLTVNEDSDIFTHSLIIQKNYDLQLLLEERYIENRKKWIIVCFTYVLILVLCILFNNLSSVFSLTGSVGAAGLNFVLPSFFIIMILRQKKIYDRYLGLYYASMVFGIIIGVVCVIFQILLFF